ncbi:MAG: hypothetical protein WBA89_22805 [Microcoleus sp.]
MVKLLNLLYGCKLQPISRKDTTKLCPYLYLYGTQVWRAIDTESVMMREL